MLKARLGLRTCGLEGFAEKVKEWWQTYSFMEERVLCLLRSYMP